MQDKKNIALWVLVVLTLVSNVVVLGSVFHKSNGSGKLGVTLVLPQDTATYVTDPNTTSNVQNGYFWGDMEVKNNTYLDATTTMPAGSKIAGLKVIGGGSTVITATQATNTLSATLACTYSDIIFLPGGTVTNTLTLTSSSSIKSTCLKADGDYTFFYLYNNSSGTSTLIATSSDYTLYRTGTSSQLIAPATKYRVDVKRLGGGSIDYILTALASF